jgi:hypothetical protein
MNRATNRWQRIDSIIEVPVDDTMPLTERLSKIATEAARLAVDGYRKSHVTKKSEDESLSEKSNLSAR